MCERELKIKEASPPKGQEHPILAPANKGKSNTSKQTLYKFCVSTKQNHSFYDIHIGDTRVTPQGRVQVQRQQKGQGNCKKH